jgi:hypothetical protein
MHTSSPSILTSEIITRLFTDFHFNEMNIFPLNYFENEMVKKIFFL